MKWNNMSPGLGRSAKALAVSLALILGVSACSRDYTVAYLYVTAKTAGTTGLINAYAIDYQSGSLEPLADSPIPSGGKNPVGLAKLPDGNGLFVINHDDSTIVAFNIGTDGKLYASATYTTAIAASGSTPGQGGTFPTSLAVDLLGKFLYVTYTYQTGYTTASPGPGGVAIFPIIEKTSPTVVTLGTPTFVNVGLNPVGVSATVVPNASVGTVVVVDQDTSPAGVPVGVLLAYSQNLSTGALTPLTGGGAFTLAGGSVTPIANGFKAGTLPGSVVTDPTGRFVYVSDQSTNQIYGDQIQGTTLNSMLSSPFGAGNLPMGMTIDPRGTFLYVANYNSNTVSGYTIDTIKGNLTAIGTAAVATGPTCVTIENALGIYLFTSNQLDDSVSGEQLDPHSGGLKGIQGTQFNASHLPTCAVSTAIGAHASQLITY